MILLRIASVLMISMPALANELFLTVVEIDGLRDRATIRATEGATVPMGTVLRIHGKQGTCNVRIMDRIKDELVADTTECDNNILTPGMRLAYNTDTTGWPEEGRFDTGESTTTNETLTDFMAAIKNRVSVYLGHNFSSNLEGKVYADGSYKDLSGSSAFSLGVLGNVYNITPLISVNVGFGYEFARTFDEATYIQNNAETRIGVAGSEPELTIWSLMAQTEFQLMDKLRAFGGLNLSLPSVRRVPWSMKSDVGFQVGANYEVIDNLMAEALIKITNMNLKNEFGETTDVSLSGLEVRGRYTF